MEGLRGQSVSDREGLYAGQLVLLRGADFWACRSGPHTLRSHFQQGFTEFWGLGHKTTPGELFWGCCPSVTLLP